MPTDSDPTARDFRRRRRPVPRTVRGRATAAVTAITAVALAACAVVLVQAVHSDLFGSAQSAARARADTAARQLRNGTAPGVVEAADPNLTLSAPSTVTVASGPPPTESMAGPGQERDDGQDQDAVGATTLTVATVQGPVVVRVRPDFASARSALATMAWTLLPGSVLLLGLVACLTWYAMGRALRPVEAIRSQFAEISAQNLQHRVPVPSSGDEVASLAITMNTTLDRLQRAVGRLRTFTSDASHELRGPLTTLRIRLELALADPDRADWPETGRESLRDAARLEEIVTDLLLLARLDARHSLEKRRVRVTDLVRRVVEEQYAERPVAVVLPKDDAGVRDTVSGSPSALSRLLVNLIDNSLRHARSSASVEVAGDGVRLVIEVGDDGPGIPEADRERVFDRFTRLDDSRARAGGGTGLGLAIARDIAAAHGGSLTAETPRPGRQGARLVLTLPLERESATGVARVPLSAAR